MKKIILAVSMLFTVSIANAAVITPAIGSVFVYGIGILGPYWAALNAEQQACEKEPLRTVAWKNNSNGYSFTVTGCDYQANKEKYVVK